VLIVLLSASGHSHLCGALPSGLHAIPDPQYLLYVVVKSSTKTWMRDASSVTSQPPLRAGSAPEVSAVSGAHNRS
jgi:hypothetical protein